MLRIQETSRAEQVARWRCRARLSAALAFQATGQGAPRGRIGDSEGVLVLHDLDGRKGQ